MYNIFQKFDLMLYRIASYIQQQPLVWHRTYIVIRLVDFESYYRGIFMVLTVSIITRDARINASGIVGYVIVCFTFFMRLTYFDWPFTSDLLPTKRCLISGFSCMLCNTWFIRKENNWLDEIPFRWIRNTLLWRQKGFCFFF